jgi:hypothetical protein
MLDLKDSGLVGRLLVNYQTGEVKFEVSAGAAK